MLSWRDGLCLCIGDKEAYELLEWGNSAPGLALAHLTGLTKPQLISLHAYTRNRGQDGLTVFQSINGHLRFPDGIAPASDISQALDALIVTVISAIEDLPTWNGICYRRATLPSEMLEEARTGTFSDAGFLSCSARSDLAVFAGRDLLVLRSGTGRLIGEVSANPDEEEVIFLPNTRFVVAGLEETPDGAILLLNEV